MRRVCLSLAVVVAAGCTPSECRSDRDCAAGETCFVTDDVGTCITLRGDADAGFPDAGVADDAGFPDAGFPDAGPAELQLVPVPAAGVLRGGGHVLRGAVQGPGAPARSTSATFTLEGGARLTEVQP